MKTPDNIIARRATAHWEEAINKFLDTLTPRPTTEEANRRGVWLVAGQDPHGKIGLRWFAWDGKVIMDGWWDLRRNDHIIRTKDDMNAPAAPAAPAAPEPVNPSLN